jgi:hypothetical protein
MKRKINWLEQGVSLLVVFIGISAGFILQNHKEALQDRKLERKYIESFLNDAEVNIKNLEDYIENDSLWIEENKYAIKLIITDSLTYDSACALMQNMVVFSEFVEQVDTYEDILNSGNLNLIKHYSVKKQIIAYHKKLREFEFLEEYFQEYFSNHLMPFLMAKVDVFKQKIIPVEAYKSVEFTNVYAGFYSLVQQRLAGCQELLKESQNMKNELISASSKF